MIMENPRLLQHELLSLGWKDADRAGALLPTHFTVLLPLCAYSHPTPNADPRKVTLSSKIHMFSPLSSQKHTVPKGDLYYSFLSGYNI